MRGTERQRSSGHRMRRCGVEIMFEENESHREGASGMTNEHIQGWTSLETISYQVGSGREVWASRIKRGIAHQMTLIHLSV